MTASANAGTDTGSIVILNEAIPNGGGERSRRDALQATAMLLVLAGAPDVMSGWVLS